MCVQPGWYLCYWLSLFRDLVIRSDYLSPRVEPGSEATAGSAVAIFCPSLVMTEEQQQDLAAAGSTVHPKSEE